MESKAKFTHALQRVYTDAASASMDFTRSVQVAVRAASKENCVHSVNRQKHHSGQ